jgi:hypothetical protein
VCRVKADLLAELTAQVEDTNQPLKFQYSMFLYLARK